jgi:hypothetical protein
MTSQETATGENVKKKKQDFYCSGKQRAHMSSLPSFSDFSL